MKRCFEAPTKLSIHAGILSLLILLQLSLLLLFSFHSSMVPFTYFTLAQISALVMVIPTGVVVFLYFRNCPREKMSYLLALSFAAMMAVLVLAMGCILRIRSHEMLPYEWSKYLRMIWQMYALPWLVLTSGLVTVFKWKAPKNNL